MTDQDKNANTGAPASGAPVESPRSAETPRKRRAWLRIALLLLGPVLVFIVGAYVYMNSGRIAETDNAYVKATAVIISAEVAGQISEVLVRENQPVKRGEVLLRIDDEPYRVAVDRAHSQIEAVSAFLAGLHASYQKALEELELAHTNVAYAERVYEREKSLSERKLGSETDLDRARHELDIAMQQIPIIEQSLAQLRAQLGGGANLSIESHPAFRTVKSMLDNAKLDLGRTIVYAPFDGIATRVPSPGGYVAKGNPVMSVIADHDMWIDANFKETQLTHVEEGQEVVIHIDTYPDMEWRGNVQSISQATGAEFSVIPAQNASGNWVKVAQRIPVRISLEIGSNDPVLRAGMSATVAIDTGYDREPPPFLGFLQALQRQPERNVAARN